MRKTSLECVYELAKKDSRVLFVGSDIGSGTLDHFKKEFPDRFFMEGVSESHLIGMITGLALSGKIPYINTITTFLTRRAYEQILMDAALHQAPIRLIGSGGGTVYAPLGPTHVALEDIALMRSVPGMTVLAPCDAVQMRQLMPLTLDIKGPVYIRLGKGGDRVVSPEDFDYEIGKSICLKKGAKIALVTTGITASIALDAAEALNASVYHLPFIKPFDAAEAVNIFKDYEYIITIEEHQLTGGLGSMIAEIICEVGLNVRLKRIAFADGFIHRYGSQKELMDEAGVSAEGIIRAANTLVRIPHGA